MLVHWRIVIAGVAMVLMTTVSFYTITAYTRRSQEHTQAVGKRRASRHSVCRPVESDLAAAHGSLSDRIGRRPLLLSFAGIAILTAYPAMAWLVHQPSFIRLLMVELWLSFIYAGYNGAMVVQPDRNRTGRGANRRLFAGLQFGDDDCGSTPAIVTYLIHETGNRAMPGAWLSVAAAIAFFSAWFSRPAMPISLGKSHA